jgi:hypothetical protein
MSDPPRDGEGDRRRERVVEGARRPAVRVEDTPSTSLRLVPLPVPGRS